jgi:hypothetical protein
MTDVIDNAAVLEATEKTLDVIEDQLDNVIEQIEVVRNNPVVLAGVLVAGLAIGAGGGYFVAKKMLAAHYEEIAEQEISEAKVFYAQLNKVDEDGEALTPQQVMEREHGAEGLASLSAAFVTKDDVEKAREEALERKAEGRIVANTIDPEKIATKKLFEGRDSDVSKIEEFDFELELPFRTEEEPYVVTHDEAFENEPGYEMMTVTYFEGDAGFVVVDDKSEVIPEPDDAIGQKNLRFGYGSNDANIVYVRNDKMDMFFEVIRSTGSYAKEVLGFDPDEPDDSLQHSDRRRRRSSRDE